MRQPERDRRMNGEHVGFVRKRVLDEVPGERESCVDDDHSDISIADALPQHLDRVVAQQVERHRYIHGSVSLR